jgi:hypothetical protein
LDRRDQGEDPAGSTLGYILLHSGPDKELFVNLANCMAAAEKQG